MKTITPTKTVCYAVSDKDHDDYIKAGERYPILHTQRYGMVVNTLDADDIFSGYNNSLHLDGGDWRIIVREELV